MHCRLSEKPVLRDKSIESVMDRMPAIDEKIHEDGKEIPWYEGKNVHWYILHAQPHTPCPIEIWLSAQPVGSHCAAPLLSPFPASRSHRDLVVEIAS